MTRLTRAILVTLLFLFSLQNKAAASERDPALGQISSPVFTLTYASTPGNDKFDLSGTYVKAVGAPNFSFPGNSVTVSFDGGKFTQTLPGTSFACTSTGCTYSNSTAVGITSLILHLNTSTFSMAVRKQNFATSTPAKMGVFFFSVGTNVFSFTPNSPPVARISGPGSALVGELVTFDASNSSDFNSNTVNYTWSIVSQPLGSSATLSSSNNTTTSLTVTHDGAYTVKVVPHDGIAAGVPAVYTVNISGGTGSPEPLPGPNNGLIALIPNQTNYIVGESATVNLHVNVKPGNAERRYYYAVTYDDQPVALTTVSINNDYSYTAPTFTTTGSHTFKVLQYVENTDIASNLLNSINTYNNDITKANAALLFETDPAIIADLQARIAYDQNQIVYAQAQLLVNRNLVAAPAVLNLIAN
jgi:plastocyanin